MSRSTTAAESSDLVKRIMEGDMSAEDALVRRFGRGVQYVLRRETRNQDIVDDLYQETFRIALQKIRKGDLRDPSKVNAFLSSTARFVAIDYFRKEARYDTSELEDVNLPTPGQTQLGQLISQEHANLVRQTINELKNERDRTILFRFFIAQDDKKDICRDLDLTALHFNRVLHRAKQRYKTLLLEAMERMKDRPS